MEGILENSRVSPSRKGGEGFSKGIFRYVMRKAAGI